ncbi:MAG TPA: response regulator [Candidatus Aminicenantes bacterium]|nr:response regulator [Candidatus Aminicenantes bacterium]HEB35835.1 response regulator [Candidatus Aminicenantes bacterium]
MMEKILIVDDEEDFCYFVKKNLEAISNYKIIIATRGRKGIQIARKEKPDLILLDIMMPGIGGLEVLKKLKGNEKTQNIPIIMLTAKDEDKSRIKALGSFCDDYIIKPVENLVLKGKIHKVLSITK